MNNSSDMGSASLADEFRKYCRTTKLLMKCLHDTRRTFKDINAAKCMIGNHIITADLSQAEESAVEAITSQAPCIIALGQSISLCVEIINCIFGCEVLPKPGSFPWRTVLMRYGRQNRTCLLEPDGVDKSLLADTSSAAKRSPPWKGAVPLVDLELSDNDKDRRPLDIRANLPLLESGARVTLVGCSCENVIDSFNSCTADAVPVVIYAFQGDILKPEELKLLQYIHSSDPNLPVYFVRMQSDVTNDVTNGDSADTNARPTGSCSPLLFSQLRDFFNDNAGQISDMTVSHLTSESDQSSIDDVNLMETPVSGSYKPLVASLSGSDQEAARTNVFVFDQATKVEPDDKTVELINFADVEGQVSVADDKNLSPANSDSDLPTMIAQAVDRPVIDAENESSVLTVYSEIVEGLYEGFNAGLATFVKNILQCKVVSTVALLHAVHRRCLELMISSAYDMQWDTMCTPTRLKFAREKEAELYKALIRVAMKKQDEVRKIILDTVSSESENIIRRAGSLTLTEKFPSSDGASEESARNVRECMMKVQEFVLAQLNSAISSKLLGLVDVLRESYTGVLTRCLASLEKKDFDGSRSTDTSNALEEILKAAYHVELSDYTGASFMKTFIEKMKQLMHSSLWRAPSSLDDAWKRKTAASVLATLTETRCHRLAKSICAQIRNRVRSSHDCFQTSLQRLENHHTGRLKQTEQQSLSIRKNYAPRVARLSLESRSLRDLVLHGKPQIGREIGRGQYGVVYSCDSWAGLGKCAVKSVAPPDERHWNDLAMEFHYTTNIPEHSRIVSLRGSIIDYNYGSGRTPAVLLIMEQFKYDLYTAIERRMNWLNRLQVTVDVVEGIRYLHAQGLVHRDIKLKNVLLDDMNRGRLTDLGFCKPEAMMSGSIVGTPLHMAPELVTGRYDHSVDVYAFGVLFWYVCAGSVRLPSHFEVCANKEMLFTKVQQGLRPERPQDCDPECWDLMRQCWHGEPSQRPHVGELEDRLRTIFNRFVATTHGHETCADSADGDFVTDSPASDSDVDFDDLTLK